MVNEYSLLSFLKREDAYGKIALDGSVIDAVMNLGHSRDFFRRTELDYSEPDFVMIKSAVGMYRRIMNSNPNAVHLRKMVVNEEK
jgi:hypothetical protein